MQWILTQSNELSFQICKLQQRRIIKLQGNVKKNTKRSAKKVYWIKKIGAHIAPSPENAPAYLIILPSLLSVSMGISENSSSPTNIVLVFTVKSTMFNIFRSRSSKSKLRSQIYHKETLPSCMLADKVFSPFFHPKLKILSKQQFKKGGKQKKCLIVF